MLLPDRLDGYCLGIDGRDGPNLGCAGCGLEVGFRIDDRGAWQLVRLHPQALVRLPAPAERPVLGWARALRDGGPGRDLSEYRDIPAGVALAHLVAATGGRPVEPAPGPVAELFGPALAALLPPPSRGAPRVDVAGPGVGGPLPDLELVPVHPQTGEVRRPGGPAVAVPVEAELWSWLAFPSGPPRSPVIGGLPTGWTPQDLLPLRSADPVEPSWQSCANTLERLAAVREPWPRALHRRW
ncbi:hypothetical protein [Kitasatospora sp. NPDC094015]|uniref:hypothetical protein n=1 Tax=Kitasatospora sp. NPDC094015 TaxID=3155205 RepID=UPI00332B5F49